ncbi:hypothetical protein QVD99_002932 [Batrachochytrium dendrobatidis]|nr:hypothetical protein QVD99_002932 [Batrachochytrium dendrobatidis]
MDDGQDSSDMASPADTVDDASPELLPTSDWAPMIIGVLGRISQQLGNIEQRLFTLEENSGMGVGSSDILGIPKPIIPPITPADLEAAVASAQPGKRKRACATLFDERMIGVVSADPISKRHLLFQLLLISTSQADPRAVGTSNAFELETPLKKLCSDNIKRIRKEISTSKLEGRLDTLFLEAANSNIVQHIVSNFDLPTSCMTPFKQYRANSLDTSAIGNFSCAFLARHFVWPLLLRWIEDRKMSDVLVSTFTREYGNLFHKVYTAVKNSMRPLAGASTSNDDITIGGQHGLGLMGGADTPQLGRWFQQRVPVYDTGNSISTDPVSLSVIYHSSQQLYTLANMPTLDMKSLALASAIAHSSNIDSITPHLLVHRRNIKSCFFEFAARMLQGVKTFDDLVLATAQTLQFPPHGENSLGKAFNSLDIGEYDHLEQEVGSAQFFYWQVVRLLLKEPLDLMATTEYPIVNEVMDGYSSDIAFVSFIHMLMVLLMTPNSDTKYPKVLGLTNEALTMGPGLNAKEGLVFGTPLINFQLQNPLDASVAIAAAASAVATTIVQKKAGVEKPTKTASAGKGKSNATASITDPESNSKTRKSKQLKNATAKAQTETILDAGDEPTLLRSATRSKPTKSLKGAHINGGNWQAKHDAEHDHTEVDSSAKTADELQPKTFKRSRK